MPAPFIHQFTVFVPLSLFSVPSSDFPLPTFDSIVANQRSATQGPVLSAAALHFSSAPQSGEALVFSSFHF